MQKSAAQAEHSKSKQNTLSFYDVGVRITPEKIKAYLESLQQKRCTHETIQTYRRSLEAFYKALPDGKLIGIDTLNQWVESLTARGYKPRTINVHLSVVNGFLDFLNLNDYQIPQQMSLPRNEALPELTRTEYLRLLSTARALDKERTYLMIKLFACTGLALEDIPRITADVVEAGRIITVNNGVQRIVRFPACLREELLDYIQREGRRTGPVFATRTGKPVNRTVITGSIQRLGHDADIAQEKCNPRCLRKLYQSTWAGIEANFLLMIEQAHERLLETEQLTIGWEGGEKNG